MSGTTRAITLRLDVAGAEKLQADLKALGTAGEDVLRRLEEAARRAGQRGGGLSAINDNIKEGTTQFGRLGAGVQSAGYQLQDFIVQVQGGTSALTALSQQGSQFLAAFGPAGAVAGVALAIGTIVAKLYEVESATEAVQRANDLWKKSVEGLRDLYETATERAKRLNDERVRGIQIAQQQIEKEATLRAEQLSSRARTVEGELDAAVARRNAMSGNGLARQAIDRTIADLERRLASLRGDAEAATAEARAAREIIDAAPKAAGRSALEQSRQDLADAQRLAGLNPQQRAIEQARISAEREANERNMQGLEREEYIRNKVAAATLQQSYASGQAAQTEEKRFASAMRAGETQIINAREQLDLARKLADAETPREQFLARQNAEIERATASLRARVATETDPAIKAALADQIAQIRQMRIEAVGLEESIRNRNALWQQGQAFARQDAVRQSLGMTPDERARFLGEFYERQRIEAQGLDPLSPEALERIRQAGELAYGDEQLRKLQTFQGTVANMGDTFVDAFGRAILEGKKLGDVLQDLERILASAILRQFVAQPLNNALGALAGQVGTYLFGSNPAVSMAPPPVQVPFADGGVMTPFGPLPLRKYASGGIAWSPQVAIFGEGRRPEAYVPLPDGRSIPVTMNGAQGNTVIQIDARGAEAGVEQKIRMILAQSLPGILAASRADQARRVNLGGADAKIFGRRV